MMFVTMDKWLANVEGDSSGLPLKDKIIKKGWASKSELRRFGHTGNNPATAGDRA